MSLCSCTAPALCTSCSVQLNANPPQQHHVLPVQTHTNSLSRRGRWCRLHTDAAACLLHLVTNLSHTHSVCPLYHSTGPRNTPLCHYTGPHCSSASVLRSLQCFDACHSAMSSSKLAVLACCAFLPCTVVPSSVLPSCSAFPLPLLCLRPFCFLLLHSALRPSSLCHFPSFFRSVCFPPSVQLLLTPCTL